MLFGKRVPHTTFYGDIVAKNHKLVINSSFLNFIEVIFFNINFETKEILIMIYLTNNSLNGIKEVEDEDEDDCDEE